VKVEDREILIALGIDFNPEGQVLTPKLLASKENDTDQLKIIPESICEYPYRSDGFTGNNTGALAADEQALKPENNVGRDVE